MAKYFGIEVSSSVLSAEVESRIREIVREELAARREQPEVIGLTNEQYEVIAQFFDSTKLKPTI